MTVNSPETGSKRLWVYVVIRVLMSGVQIDKIIWNVVFLPSSSLHLNIIGVFAFGLVVTDEQSLVLIVLAANMLRHTYPTLTLIIVVIVGEFTVL